MVALKAKFIIEILGRPVEHLEKTLADLVEKMGTEKGVSLLKKEINKPKKVEKAENLWTTFADIDLSFESLPVFMNTVINYMPAHVEVYEPDMFKINTFEMNEFVNFVVSRLHNFDALAKRMMGEREILISKLDYIRKGGNPKDVFAPQQTPVIPQEQKTETKKETKKKKKK
ncbi:hypothetical protein FJZ21_01300 [Candidatus Pacearchaeota archaeon]|nr:hypothetical protein [Candidatus Pacearchaeota archaeon]